MDYYEVVKRIVDLCGSIVGIIVFSPIMIGISIYIMLVSPGPVFADIPLRIGRDGKLFKMYKFRSMIPNAHQYLLDHPELYEEYVHNNYKLTNDPRWLRGAKAMRKYSLDELPQFLNVFRGEMSLVGPRAYYPFELERQQKVHPQAVPYVKKLLTVKPGITGPWQVGGRSELNFVERVKIDADYADNRSIINDLKIIIKTPLAMMSGRGAV
jgi:lipopolysaccharide/colanic/teichoic acid biosynthesis glycosyltransferase